MTAPDAQGRDLRPRLRHRRLPDRRLGVPGRPSQRCHLPQRRGPPPVQRGHLPRLRLRQHHAAHRQHEHAAARGREPGHPLPDSLAQSPRTTPKNTPWSSPIPPFAGSLDYESTAKDLQQIVKTKKTELLFLALFLRLLQTGGRAAVIVPDGVLFGSSKAHKTLRRILVEDQKLDAVISMPSGVFKPYAGVSRRFCSSPRPTPAAPTRLVLRHAVRRLLAGRQAYAAAGQEDLPDILSAGRTAMARPDANAPTELPRAQVRDCRERLRPLHQPLQGGGIRGGGV
jgi:hypothetical protein